MLGSRRSGSGVLGSRRVGFGTRVGFDGCRFGWRFGWRCGVRRGRCGVGLVGAVERAWVMATNGFTCVVLRRGVYVRGATVLNGAGLAFGGRCPAT